MLQPRLCLQTQTPAVRLLRPTPAGARLEDLQEGVDHLVSPGGVTRMILGLARRLEQRGVVSAASWVSLSTDDARLRSGRSTIDLVTLPPPRLREYATAKAALWSELHSGEPRLPVAALRAGLEALGATIGARSAALHDDHPFDAFYTHDFQLLEVAKHLPRRVPRVFRWHVPVRTISPATRAYVAHALDAYDAVIVSTQAYARELRSWGVRVPVHASYPYIEEARRRVVTEADIEALESRHGLRPDDVVFSVVARMDPIKSQDVAIRALARLREAAPRVKLLLVGGGGFSGGRKGLGLPEASSWRRRLASLARDLRVEDRVVFTGGIPDEELDAAITRSRAILLPSALEGFGLAPVEGWLYGRPAIVSRGAGVSELVKDGRNGFTFAPGDDAGLAAAMALFARDEDAAARMGTEGRRTARACYVDRGADDEWRILSAAAPRGLSSARSLR